MLFNSISSSHSHIFTGVINAQ